MTTETWDEWELLEGYEFQSEQSLERWKTAANKLGLTAWDLAVFESIWYEYAQVQSLARFKRYCFGGYEKKYPEQANMTVERIFANGWVQYLDADFVSSKSQELRREGYELVNGLIGRHERDRWNRDQIWGLISYTEKGINLYRQWEPFDASSHEDPGHYAFAIMKTGQFVVYGTTLEACLRALNHKTVRKSSSPETIGRWCDRWWNKFESGVRIFYEVDDQD
ncbi:hypothetical protein [uncultured Rubinisphaera sp.]|uniref:hypothetical protein n=1 Tax=uncultured Rubinisphaera sp. TaxID=1678686 RepID=UPI0030D7656E